MKPFYTSVIQNCIGQREIIIVVLDHIFKNGNELQNLIIVQFQNRFNICDFLFVIEVITVKTRKICHPVYKIKFVS